MSKLVEIHSVAPTVKIDLKYATTDNFTGVQLYPTEKAYLLEEVAFALKRVQEQLASDGLGLVVWDAYRPLSVTQKMWDMTPPEHHVYVSDPAAGSVHNRGCAVDVTLINLGTGVEQNMPSAFDTFDHTAWPNFTKASDEALHNRNMLRHVMESHGFSVNIHEWWHYDWNEFTSHPILDNPIEAL